MASQKVGGVEVGVSPVLTFLRSDRVRYRDVYRPDRIADSEANLKLI